MGAPSQKSRGQKNSAKEAAQERKKISLALQGGGAHGAFTWGVLDRFLEDERFEIEGISGTSAGGMNAVALAQGFIKGGREGARQELHAFWKQISDMAAMYTMPSSPVGDWFKAMQMPNFASPHLMMNLMQSLFSPYQMNPMNINVFKDFVESFFDFELLRKHPIFKLFLCATHVETGKLKLFTQDELTAEKVLASACLPFLFHAVEVEGEYYWDGGFVGNPAIYPLIYECESPDIVVVQLTVMNRKGLPMTAQEVIDRHKEITYNACLMREMRSIEFITTLIEKGVIKKDRMKRLNTHLIRDEEFFAKLELSSALSPNWPFLDSLFQEGRRCTDAWLKTNARHIGVRDTANLHKEFVEEA